MSPSSFSKITIFAAALLFQTALGICGPIEELMARGDACDQHFSAAEALKCYLPAEKLEPKNVHVLTRIARQYRHLMQDATAPAEKLRLGRIAIDYSERAVSLDPDDAEAQLSVAISLGKVMPQLPMKEQVTASYRIKATVDNSLRLDPHNDLAWHVLGRWNRVLADVSATKRLLAPIFAGKLPRGTNADAVKCLEKAIEIDPNRLMHYIELGRVYAQMGNAAEARRLIEKGLSMPNTEKDDPEEKVHGRETLEKLH